jgi:hypothetical protein
MTPRAAARLAFSLAALCVVVFMATVTLFFLARTAPVPGGSSASRTLVDLLVSVPILAFPLVGVLIASRRPGNPIGWICLADGLLWTLLGLFDFYSVYGLAEPGSVPFPAAVAGLSLWLWVPTVGLVAIYLVLLFPDGKLPSRRWRPLAWLSGLVIVPLAAAEGFSPGPVAELGGVRNPFGLEGQNWLAGATNVLLAAFLGCIVASAASLVLRYRNSGGAERQQIKWIAFAASFVGFGFVVAMASGLVALALAPELWPEANAPPLWFDLFFSVVLLSFGGVPTAVGIAVLKYRLYDIDLLINRALVYGSLTFTLAFSYVVSVVVLQALFRALTGQGSQLAVVVSTLAIAALFSPLRHRLQAFVDRRFYREKYDARRALERLSARLRAETDLDMLGKHLVGAIGEAMRPAHASLWLRPEGARQGEPTKQEGDVS